MDRRSFLKFGGQLGLGLLGLSFGGCQADPNAPQILGLKGAVPNQLIKTFQQQADRRGPGGPLVYRTADQIPEIFARLQDWQRQAKGMLPPPKSWLPPLLNFGAAPLSAQHLPELVSLGDYWLTIAITQGLIQPLDPNPLQNWGTIDDRWKQLVSRNVQGQPDPTGLIWGAPYRWGATVIAYRRDLFEAHGLPLPQDWGDLLQPALKGRISLPDNPRETIGLALKLLGQSYNSDNLAAIPELESTLRQLHQQAKFYSTDAYLQPLLLGHTWLAIGSSADVLPLLRTQPTVEAIVPQSGTALWADLWVRPTALSPNPTPNLTTQNSAYHQWIDFCLNPETSHRLALLGRSGSPLVQRDVAPQADVPGSDRNPLLHIAEPIWQKSEALLPLDRVKAEQYRSLWAKIRQ